MADKINKERQLAGWLGKFYLEHPITMFLIGVLLVCGVAVASYFALELLAGAALLAAAAGVTALCTALATMILQAAHSAIVGQAKGNEKAKKAQEAKEAELKAKLDEVARNEQNKGEEEVVNQDGTKQMETTISAEPLSKQEDLEVRKDT